MMGVVMPAALGAEASSGATGKSKARAEHIHHTSAETAGCYSNQPHHTPTGQLRQADCYSNQLFPLLKKLFANSKLCPVAD